MPVPDAITPARSARARLWLTWAALISLTVAAGLAAEVAGTGRLGPLALTVIAGITVLKARLILSSYLGLRAGAAMTALTLMVAMTLIIVVASFALVPTPSRLDRGQGSSTPDIRR